MLFREAQTGLYKTLTQDFTGTPANSAARNPFALDSTSSDSGLRGRGCSSIQFPATTVVPRLSGNTRIIRTIRSSGATGKLSLSV